MKKKIENPKVFISYAWASPEYEQKVLALSCQLVGDGIEVVIDKWNLTEGNDTYAFMEQCATDPTITNVLILLDPVYAKKADEHIGGVGTETQIISAKVYQSVTQEKFIPVVMERDEFNNICKPTYLQSRLHFDLSTPETYDEAYQRLVKSLYGVEIYAKPELGRKPSWVENPIVFETKRITTYDTLKNEINSKVKKEKFRNYLDEISKRLLNFCSQNQTFKVNDVEYLALYDSLNVLKSDYLLLLKNSSYVDDNHKMITVFFEDTVNALSSKSCSGYEIVKVLIHELFLYTIAYFIKNKDWSSVGYILGKTYFDRNGYRTDMNADSYKIFYSGMFHSNLDNAVCTRDGKKYHSGTAQYWMDNIDVEFCTKEQFVLADLICFNYAVYGKNYISNWAWFPITYVYDNAYNSQLATIAKKMVSKEYLQEILPLFGYDTVEEFLVKVKSIEEFPTGTYRDYRFSGSFDSASLLGQFIKAEQMATLR